MYDVFVKLNVTLAIEYIYGSSLKRKDLNASGSTILLALMILECLINWFWCFTALPILVTQIMFTTLFVMTHIHRY